MSRQGFLSKIAVYGPYDCFFLHIKKAYFKEHLPTTASTF